MKEFIKNNKWIKIIFVIEVAVVLFLICTSFGKRHEYDIDFDSFYSEYDNVGITSDGNLMILATDEADDAGEDGDTSDADEEVEGTVLFYSDDMEIAGGVYDVYVDYETNMTQGDEILLIGGYFSCVSTDSLSCYIKASDSKIIYGNTESHGRYWIHTTFINPTIQLQYTSNDIFDVIITDITIRENLLGRVWRVVSCLLIFLIIDALILAFAGSFFTVAQKRTGLIILIFTAGASLLAFTDVFSMYGDDMKFHLQRIVCIANELSYGQFPVRMQSDMLHGYGYASSLFYSDFFLYLPAVLYNLTVPLSVCMQIYIILINLTTACIAYGVFRRIFHSDKLGLMGSGLYAFSAYRLYNMYTRCAIGEITAAAFYPLVALGIYNIQKAKGRVKLRDCLPLIIGMSCIIESHILSCYMICIALVLYVLLNAKQFLTKDKLCAILKSGLLTLLINASFIIPFIDSYSMDIVVKNTSNDSQKYGLDFIEMFSMFFGKELEDGIITYRSAGLVLLMGLVIYILLHISRDRYKLKGCNEIRYGNRLVWLSLIVIFFASEYFPYQKLAYISDILENITDIMQFPWRWLGILTLTLTIIFICALSMMHKSKAAIYERHIICIAIIITLVSTYSYYSYEVLYTNEKYSAYYESDIEGPTLNVGAAEYMLGDTMYNANFVCTVNSPLSDSEDMQILDWVKDGDERYLSVYNAGDAAVVYIPVFAYDNYEAYDDIYDFEIVTSDDYRIGIIIPAGYTGTITISYEKPFLWTIAELISYITILLLIFNKWIFKRKTEEELSEAEG